MKIYYIFCLLLLSSSFSSCKKYLSETPDNKLVLPQSLNDLQRLLNYEDMRYGYLIGSEVTSDNFYIATDAWETTQNLGERNLYIWKDDITDGLAYHDWQKTYDRVFTANVILDELKTDKYNSESKADFNNLKAQALFYRTYNFYFLSQQYSPAYQDENHDSPYGIPLKMTADINAPTKRATVNETYKRMIVDLHTCEQHLPPLTDYGRPSKAAVYGLLSRIYLSMRQYDSCYKYTDKCLAIQSDLLNYNNLDPLSSYPFTAYNKEVVFSSASTSGEIFNPSKAKVDSNLYNLYDKNDLRKLLYYYLNDDGSHRFKGSYYGTSSCFNGIAVDEMYLNKAESAVRIGNTTEAINELNTLLQKRWDTGTHGITLNLTADSALKLILQERRKELAFRPGLRWADLKRLNLDKNTATTLLREVDGKSYQLLPNDPRYTFLIPFSVIEATGIQQNPR